jgi:DNA topoisomerase IB
MNHLHDALFLRDIMTDNSEIIKESGLVYITDQASGIYRKGKSGHFFYVNKDGHRIQDEEQLKRIISLVLPPAWTSVWISPKANSHLPVVNNTNTTRNGSNADRITNILDYWSSAKRFPKHESSYRRISSDLISMKEKY